MDKRVRVRVTRLTGLASAAAALAALSACASTPTLGQAGWAVRGSSIHLVTERFTVPKVTCYGGSGQLLIEAAFNVFETRGFSAGLMVGCPASGAAHYGAVVRISSNSWRGIVLTNPSDPGAGIIDIHPGDTFTIEASTTSSGSSWLIRDVRADGSKSGSASGGPPTGSNVTSAGCLVETNVDGAIPHFGMINVGPCLVGEGPIGSPSGHTWEIGGAIKSADGTNTRPDFSLIGFKVVTSGGALRVGVTEEGSVKFNGFPFYSVVQFAP